jgi:hypothetical protein
MISFRADDEVLRALQILENAVGASVVSKRSVAIRQAILAAVERLTASTTNEEK